MKQHTQTAHFQSLNRAVTEARKYGVTQQFGAIQVCIQQKQRFIHYITHTRALTISRVPGGAWKLAVDVQGRVVPVNVKAVSVPFVGTLKEETREKTQIQQAFCEAAIEA